MSFYCVRFTSCVVEDDCVEASLEAADGGAALAVAVLADLADSLVDGVEAAEAVSMLGLGVDGAELADGWGLEEIGLGVLAATAACGVTAALAAGVTGAGAGVLADRIGAVFAVVVATFFDGVLADLGDSAGGCDVFRAFGMAVPASAAIAGPPRASVAVPASAVGVFDAVLAALVADCGAGGSVLFFMPRSTSSDPPITVAVIKPSAMPK